MSVDLCRLIEFHTVSDARGSLTSTEARSQIPFEIKRVFYIYNVPVGSQRGGHSHREMEEVVIAAAGSFDILLDDGQETKLIHLSDSSQGLYIHPSVWRELKNFSGGAVCLALASHAYDKDDYVRDYELFRSAQSEAAHLGQLRRHL
jgi:dTDP-4-dehydrorhamnose 3,5-epimerase-like enzyme